MPVGTGQTGPRKAAAPRASAKVNDKVIELRSVPRSFADIARELHFDSARDAFDAFLVAVQSRSVKEQRSLRTEENGRLDDLEKRTRRRSSPEQLDRKLAAIAQLRERLIAATS